MEYLDPNQFIITRKRKKYRFAKFKNSPICFEYDEWSKRPVDCIEVGAGDGIFAVQMAANNPQYTYLALDVKGDRLQKGAYAAEELGLKNIYFIRARANQITDIVNSHSLRELWITFPDPFPRKRSAGRRLTATYFLNLYKEVLASDGRLYLKHDNRDFFDWSLEQLVTGGWVIKELAFDLHEDHGLSDTYKLLTTYEKKWLSEGLKTNFVCAKIE